MRKLFVCSILMISLLGLAGCVTTLQNLKATDILTSNSGQGVVFGRWDIDVIGYRFQIGNYETKKVYEVGASIPPKYTKQCWDKSEYCGVPFYWSLPAGKYSIYNFIDYSNPFLEMATDPKVVFEVKPDVVTYIGTFVGRRVEGRALLGNKVTAGYKFKIENEFAGERALYEGTYASMNQPVSINLMSFQEGEDRDPPKDSFLPWSSSSVKFEPQKNIFASEKEVAPGPETERAD